MPQAPSCPSFFNFFILTLTAIFCTSHGPSVLAQKFKPAPDSNKCSAFVEGRVLYLLGGEMKENFMLDLSVSWNTSDPAYKKLDGGPEAKGTTCAITNNGEDLFVMSTGVGYIYNVKSNSWRPFSNPNFAAGPKRYSAVTDPETGIIYLPDGGVDFTGRVMMLSVDIKTETVNKTGTNPYMISEAVWNTYLKSMVVATKENGLMIFTPSKVTMSSDGWGSLNITPGISWSWDCGVSAYGGSVMVFIGSSPLPGEPSHNAVYILDVVKQTWKEGPPIPRAWIEGSSCAISGDQVVIWEGSLGEKFAGVTFTTTFVFNIKSEKWVSSYIPPPLQPSQTPVTISEPGNTSFSDKKLVIIIAAITGTLLAAILGLIFRFYRRTRQLDPNKSSRGPLDIKDSVKTSRPGLVGRLHQGVFGAKQVSEHPHAIVEDPTMKRNIQEGALEIQIPPQHPHTMVGRQELAIGTPPQHPHAMVDKHTLAIQITPQHPHAIGKQELEDQ
ncbi:MAG: hypothetical protein J3Q66DRAFT_199785 [Benniella sp.]|nr:MAG: hypothetical protein J3Q66DRAFT_199785 [Benniella sp.]